jgi:predicted HicB family RNase H-like nuclease
MADSRRRRTHIYAERREFALRVSEPLYERLSAACAAAGISTTSYVSTVIELTAADRDDRQGLDEFDDPMGPDGGRVHVSIRMAPSAYAAVQAAAKRAGVSMNRFAAWSIARVVMD